MGRRFAALCYWAVLFFLAASPAYPWGGYAHLAIAKAAGYERWHDAMAADIMKIKLCKTEELNHAFFDESALITAELALQQVKRYDSTGDKEGHLYGAIIAAVREYRKGGDNKDAHLSLAAHYIGDLSNPLHNIAFDGFNASHHGENDRRVDPELVDHPDCVVRTDKIAARMYEVRINHHMLEAELAQEISRIAILSRQLGKQVRAENRNMTAEEAYIQLGHSASLLKALLKAL